MSTTRVPLRAAVALAAGLALAGPGLTGCGASGDEPPGGGAGGGSATSRTPSGPSSSPTTDVEVPAGVTLTHAGAQLAFGDSARVAYEVARPASGKKGSEGKKKAGTVLALTVDSAVKGSLADLAGFNLTSAYQKQANYYYVRVTVRNVGVRRFGDVGVPLWGINGEDRLLPPVRFTSAFAKCPTEPLPQGFAPGARFQTCLVFLSPDKGKLEGVSYRPTDDFLPIEWRGKVVAPGSERKGDRRSSGGG
jgi:hypothetical protein